MQTFLPKVALLIESSRNYGRGILRGIAHYAHVNGPWSIYSQERELHSGIPGWLKSWKGDGIIARIEDRRMAQALSGYADGPWASLAEFNIIQGNSISK